QIQLARLFLDGHAGDQCVDERLVARGIGAGRQRAEAGQQDHHDSESAPERSEHGPTVPHAPRTVRVRARTGLVKTLCSVKAAGGLVGGLGFEPRLAESESAVLPLDDPPARVATTPVAPQGMKRESSAQRRALQPIWPDSADCAGCAWRNG